MRKCLVHRAGDAWSAQYPPDGKPNHVVQFEDDVRFFARHFATELCAAGFEMASDWLRDEAAGECEDG